MPEINVALTPPTPPSSPDLSRAKGFASLKLVPWVPPHDWNVLQPRRRSWVRDAQKKQEFSVYPAAHEHIETPIQSPTLARPQTPAQSPEQSPTQAVTQIVVQSLMDTETQLSVQPPTPTEAETKIEPDTETELTTPSPTQSQTQIASQPPEPEEFHTQLQTPTHTKRHSETPLLNGIAVAHNSLLELTRYQRFIRRMESAGPKVILDRLKEEWIETSDDETNEELHLEKRLWVL